MDTVPMLIDEAICRLRALGYDEREASVARAGEHGPFTVTLSGTLVEETTLELASLLNLIRSLPSREQLVSWRGAGGTGNRSAEDGRVASPIRGLDHRLLEDT